MKISVYIICKSVVYDSIVVLLQVTYMLEGSFSHEDFCGHKGTINPGDLQVSMWKLFDLVAL